MFTNALYLCLLYTGRCVCVCIYVCMCVCIYMYTGFPGVSVVKNLPASAGDIGLIPHLVRSTCCGAAKPTCHNY